MPEFGIVTVTAITALCFIVGLIVKKSMLDDEYIPIICGLCGIPLGILGLYVMPEFPANDPITAAAVGAASGLAATGVHQLYKQIKKLGEKKNEK